MIISVERMMMMVELLLAKMYVAIVFRPIESSIYHFFIILTIPFLHNFNSGASGSISRCVVICCDPMEI